MATPLSTEHVSAIMPNAWSNGLGNEWDYCLTTLRNYEINNKNRMAAFFMNLAKESGELYYVEEIADGWDYEWREDLGNTQAGDGPRYKGHGYIQITGRLNHRKVGEALGVDFEAFPQLLMQMPYPWYSAGWYWRHGSSWGNLNVYADAGDYRSTILGVRGGPDADRERYWERAMNVLPDNVEIPQNGGGEAKMAKAADLVAAARSFIGCPYKWWTGVYPEPGPPGYMDWQDPGYYTPAWVSRQGVHCAGLMNLARMECGLSPIGLTRQWEDWLWDHSLWFDPSEPGVAGAICVRGWEGGMGPGAEGHVAMYTDAHTLIQAEPNGGVWEGEQDYDSHKYNYYRIYAQMPDVDYSDASSVEPPASEEIRYLGLSGKWPNINGDYERGWIPASKIRIMRPDQSYEDV